MEKIFENNRKWVAEKLKNDKNYFKKLALGQKPRYLFIGCSDSRVPANDVCGTGPGEMFVHRNIANVVVNTDMNMLSVLQYAVEVLGVQDVIVCGHYGCGGVKAAMGDQQYGLIDNWLRNIKDIMPRYQDELQDMQDEDARWRRLVELNVLEQVNNLYKTTIVQNALNAGKPLRLHGLVYDIANGILKDTKWTTEDFKHYAEVYHLTIDNYNNESTEELPREEPEVQRV
ncbi:carbonic anhydrase [Adhaeribacter radiodurans]|uniref:Carbonic anhydrase n=1 Tax=Adhaeribacter radiodurans TaxID=2745197 RepID=A0A7L7L9P5_9BACT|nr:carbonic anhydrase [Adhaeribacter radiodurans]QMU29109.1 carbonic anhydrase [Adhaeribacter radiodurans]